MDEFDRLLGLLLLGIIVLVPLVIIVFRKSGAKETEQIAQIKSRKHQMWQQWAKSKHLNYYPGLGNLKRDEIQKGLESHILDPQGFMQMAKSSVEHYQHEFDSFNDKMAQYFSGNTFINDTDDPILTGKIGDHRLMLGSVILGRGEAAYPGQRLGLDYPNPPAKLDAEHCGQTQAQQTQLADIQNQMHVLGARIIMNPEQITIECHEIKSMDYADRLYKLTSNLLDLLRS